MFLSVYACIHVAMCECMCMYMSVCPPFYIHACMCTARIESAYVCLGLGQPGVPEGT